MTENNLESPSNISDPSGILVKRANVGTVWINREVEIIKKVVPLHTAVVRLIRDYWSKLFKECWKFGEGTKKVIKWFEDWKKCLTVKDWKNSMGTAYQKDRKDSIRIYVVEVRENTA